MHGVLHRGLSHTRAVGDLIDWQVAYPVALHLAGDDEKRGALALGVVVAEPFAASQHAQRWLLSFLCSLRCSHFWKIGPYPAALRTARRFQASHSLDVTFTTFGRFLAPRCGRSVISTCPSRRASCMASFPHPRGRRSHRFGVV